MSGTTRNEVLLKIKCRECDIENITKTLGIVPTEVQQIHKCKRNDEHYENNEMYWIYSTGKRDTLFADLLLDELTWVFAPKVYLLRKMKEKIPLKVDIDIISYIRNKQSPSISIETTVVRMAYKLGAEINVILQFG